MFWFFNTGPPSGHMPAFSCRRQCFTKIALIQLYEGVPGESYTHPTIPLHKHRIMQKNGTARLVCIDIITIKSKVCTHNATQLYRVGCNKFIDRRNIRDRKKELYPHTRSALCIQHIKTGAHDWPRAYILFAQPSHKLVEQ